MRGTPKSRPSILKTFETPDVAGDAEPVKLTSVKSNPDLVTATSMSGMVTRKRTPKATGILDTCISFQIDSCIKEIQYGCMYFFDWIE